MGGVRRDWPRLIAECEAAGLSLWKIGQCIGLQVTQVERLKAGSEPKHSAGELLLALHDVIVTNVSIKTPAKD